MSMLSNGDKKELANVFKYGLQGETRIIYFTQGDKADPSQKCHFCKDTEELLREVESLSPKLKLEVHDIFLEKNLADEYGIARVPAMALIGERDFGMRYYGIPAEREFESFIDALGTVSSGSTDLSPETKQNLGELQKPVYLQVFVTPKCPRCPEVVKLTYQIAVESELVRTDVIEVSEFPELKNKYDVRLTPKVVINEGNSIKGAVGEDSLIELIHTAGK